MEPERASIKSSGATAAAAGHTDVSVSQLPAHDGAIPPLQDIDLQEKGVPDSPTLKDEETGEGHATSPEKGLCGTVIAPTDEEGGVNGVRAIIGGFNISFCTWGFAGSWSVASP